MAGAFEMIKGARDERSIGGSATTDDDGMGMMSEGLYRILSPVLPPAVVDVVSSPFVIVDALFGAITSSGQALILPGIAFLFGVVIPGIRRRIGLEKLEGAA
jgi:hypothetical protein